MKWFIYLKNDSQIWLEQYKPCISGTVDRRCSKSIPTQCCIPNIEIWQALVRRPRWVVYFHIFATILDCPGCSWSQHPVPWPVQCYWPALGHRIPCTRRRMSLEWTPNLFHRCFKLAIAYQIGWINVSLTFEARPWNTILSIRCPLASAQRAFVFAEHTIGSAASKFHLVHCGLRGGKFAARGSGLISMTSFGRFWIDGRCCFVAGRIAALKAQTKSLE